MREQTSDDSVLNFHERNVCCQISGVNLYGTTGSIWTSKVPMDSLGPGKLFGYDKN